MCVCVDVNACRGGVAEKHGGWRDVVGVDDG